MLSKYNLSNLQMKWFGQVGVGAEVVDSKLLEGRMSAAVIKLAPNEGFEPHVHPSDHLLVILQGSGKMNCWEGQTTFSIDFEASDVVPVPRQYVHAFCAGADGCTFLSVSTPGRLLTDPDRLKHV